ncbi:hypothetical protein Anas_11520 [Armadillidium nasatum]|nr:hypothetical protein Anas_12392 [Armadillidium nasatum]KAB7501090.1 hypothetical protein Anas_07247 [Armadillidium nasatum]KAB7505187.1 hypothetical protein Anas_11520 [Armadillidium nasatum]
MTIEYLKHFNLYAVEAVDINCVCISAYIINIDELANNFETEVAELFQELTRISNIKIVEDILRESNKVVEASEVSATYKYVSRHSGTVKDVIEKFEEIRDAEKKDDN